MPIGTRLSQSASQPASQAKPSQAIKYFALIFSIYILFIVICSQEFGHVQFQF
jgi:hypothetical protein